MNIPISQVLHTVSEFINQVLHTHVSIYKFIFKLVAVNIQLLFRYMQYFIQQVQYTQIMFTLFIKSNLYFNTAKLHHRV